MRQRFWIVALILATMLLPWGSGDLSRTALAACPVTAENWHEVGTDSACAGGISNNSGNSGGPSLAIAPDGTPYVAWNDDSDGDDEIYVRRWNGSSWEEVGTGSASGGGISDNSGDSWIHDSVAVTPDGTPYVAWTDSSGGKLEIYVRRWNGGSWEEVGAGSASGGGISNNSDLSEEPSVAITPDGTPYVAWSNEAWDSGRGDWEYEIYVRRWNGSSWEEVGVGSASGGGISNNGGDSGSPSVAVAPDGTPYVAWDDSSGGNAEIYVRRWNGNSWEEVGGGSATGGGISNNSGSSYYPSIAIASDGMPYVAWQDWSGGDAEIYVRRWNGSSWVEVGTGSASSGGISNDSGDSWSPSIAISSNGTPYVAWEDESGGDSEIYARRWNGSSWEEVGAGSASGGGISDNSGWSWGPSVVIAPDGTPHVAWGDFSGGDPEIYVRRWGGTTYSISGRITDGSSNPISNVTITDGAGHTATTNSNGNYTLSGLTAGTYTITPSKSSYTFSPTSRMVTVPPDASGQDFTATRIYGGLSGRVSEKSSGRGIANARVSVGGKVKRTNANGEYTINNIPAGRHTIRVSADGYKSYKSQVTIQAGISVTRDVALEHQPSEGYRLPFPGGKKYECIQGNNEPDGSHDGKWRYAFDWGMDVGDKVVAARDGLVVAVKESSSTWGRNTKYINYANYVIIRHRDHTYTLYVHLKQNSVPVSKGNYVKSGQVVGRVGKTGWISGEAHLHFDRRRAPDRPSIPIRFLDVSSNDGVPQTGHWYRSGNYLVSSLDSLAALEQDTEPPEGSFQFRLTGQPTHQLWLDAFDYVSDDLQMRLASTYSALQTAVWQPFSGSVEWTLPEVWAQYRDEDSNVSDVYSDTIDAIAYEPIQAAFVISPTVCADSVVPLDNSTTPFCEQCGWNWDFGDGTSSIEAYPLFPDIAYADPGTYTVTLTVAGAMNISSVSKQVTVLPSPSPDFTMIRSGTTITVEASVADAASWEWDFGDGITATGRTTTHTYTEPLTETYPVRLTVRGTNGCVGVGHQYVTQSEIYLPIILKSY